MQKKILPFCLLLITIATTVNAQIKKGSTFLGGTIAFATQTSTTDNNTKYNNTNYTIAPVFGKAIKENLILGGELSYKHEVINKAYKSNGYGAGVFVRKYKELGKNFYLFGQGKLNGTYAKWDKTVQNNISLSFYPGVCYAVNKKMQLEMGFNNLLSMDYSHQKISLPNNNSNIEKINSFSIRSSLSNGSAITVGLSFIIG